VTTPVAIQMTNNKGNAMRCHKYAAEIRKVGVSPSNPAPPSRRASTIQHSSRTCATANAAASPRQTRARRRGRSSESAYHHQARSSVSMRPRMM
jgi:hypothetical protein